MDGSLINLYLSNLFTIGSLRTYACIILVPQTFRACPASMFRSHSAGDLGLVGATLMSLFDSPKLNWGHICWKINEWPQIQWVIISNPFPNQGNLFRWFVHVCSILRQISLDLSTWSPEFASPPPSCPVPATAYGVVARAKLDSAKTLMWVNLGCHGTAWSLFQNLG